MARTRIAARREAIITSWLVITGIVLAICLFAAGLFWTGKPTTKRASADGSGVRAVYFAEKIETGSFPSRWDYVVGR